MVFILPRVDLLEHTEINRFCVLSRFRLDTLLSEVAMETNPKIKGFHGNLTIIPGISIIEMSTVASIL